MKKRSVSLLALLGAVACTAGLMAGCSMQDDGLGQYDESKVVFRQLEPMKDGEEIAVVQTTYRRAFITARRFSIFKRSQRMKPAMKSSM